MVLSYIWFLATCNLALKFLIMCATATYYFNSDDEEEGRAELGLSAQLVLYYHLGSVAYGGLILSTVSFFRIFFVFWARKLSNKGRSNCFCRALATCSICILSTFEFMTDKYSEDHFTWIAIVGDDF